MSGMHSFMTRRLRFGGVMALSVGASMFVSCSKNGIEGTKSIEVSSVPVTVAQVKVVHADRTVPVVGTLFPKDEATIAAEVEGKVEKTTVDFGDRVSAGQELAHIDTTTYSALANQATANLEKTRATATNAARNLSRFQELRKGGIASTSDLDQASAQAQETAAEVRAAVAAEVVARLNVDRSRVKAPFAAAIADRIVGAGDFVKTGTPLFRVVNDLQLKFITSVPERYSSQIQKGQPAHFTVDAWPGETFHGNVLLISPAVNTKTRSLTFGILVQNPDRKLKANSYARGELILEKNAPTLQVPLEAVVSFSGLTKVFVVDGGVARVREVQVGKIANGRQEILSGLKAGETVVLSGNSKLHDGAKVTVKSVDLTHSPQTSSK